MRINNKHLRGDCFVRSFHLLVYGVYEKQRVAAYIGEPKLCQGVVWHKDLGDHIHGWVEDDVFAYDFLNGNLMPIPKKQYYRVGKIKDKDGYIKRYTRLEAAEQVYKIRNYYFSNLVIND